MGAFQEAEPSLLNYCADDSYDVMMIDGPFQEDGLCLFWNISLETVKGLQYLVLDYLLHILQQFPWFLYDPLSMYV